MIRKSVCPPWHADILRLYAGKHGHQPRPTPLPWTRSAKALRSVSPQIDFVCAFGCRRFVFFSTTNVCCGLFISFDPEQSENGRDTDGPAGFLLAHQYSPSSRVSIASQRATGPGPGKIWDSRASSGRKCQIGSPSRSAENDKATSSRAFPLLVSPNRASCAVQYFPFAASPPVACGASDFPLQAGQAPRTDRQPIRV